MMVPVITVCKKNPLKIPLESDHSEILLKVHPKSKAMLAMGIWWKWWVFKWKNSSKIHQKEKAMVPMDIW